METIEEDIYTLRLVQRQAKGDVALTFTGDIYARIFTISGTSLYGVLKEAVLYGELVRSFGGYSRLGEQAFKYHKTRVVDRGIHIVYADILDTKEVDVWDISIAHSTSTLSASELNDLLLETALSNFN